LNPDDNDALLQSALREITRLKKRIEKLETDGVTGLYVGTLLREDLFHAVSGPLASSAADGLRRGCPISNYSNEELKELWVCLAAIDVDYLTLWNQLRGSHADGNRAFRGIGSALREAGSSVELAKFYRITGGDELAGLIVGDQNEAMGIMDQAQRTAKETQVYEGQPLPVNFTYGVASLIEALVIYGRLDPSLIPPGTRAPTTVTFQLLMTLADARSYNSKVIRRMLLLTALYNHERDLLDKVSKWLTKGMRGNAMATVAGLCEQTVDQRVIAIANLIERERSEMLTKEQVGSQSRLIQEGSGLPLQATLEIMRMARLPFPATLVPHLF
jgi:hypothetical protein